MKAQTVWHEVQMLNYYIISYGWIWRDQMESDCKMLHGQVGITLVSQGLDSENVYVVR